MNEKLSCDLTSYNFLGCEVEELIKEYVIVTLKYQHRGKEFPRNERFKLPTIFVSRDGNFNFILL